MEYYLGALVSIVTVNLLLSGDNALVIALASRRLPPRQKKQAVIWGSAGAVGLRVVLTLAAAALLSTPYLQAAGGLLLGWVAFRLAADDHAAAEDVRAAADLGGAVKTILMADLVMSLDNVIAIAGVARGNLALLAVGLAVSIPLIIWGSKIIAMLMRRWPAVIVLGAAFLGWTAGDMLVADPAARAVVAAHPSLPWLFPGLLAASVIVYDFMKKGRRGGGERRK